MIMKIKPKDRIHKNHITRSFRKPLLSNFDKQLRGKIKKGKRQGYVQKIVEEGKRNPGLALKKISAFLESDKCTKLRRKLLTEDVLPLLKRAKRIQRALFALKLSAYLPAVALLMIILYTDPIPEAEEYTTSCGTKALAVYPREPESSNDNRLTSAQAKRILEDVTLPALSSKSAVADLDANEARKASPRFIPYIYADRYVDVYSIPPEGPAVDTHQIVFAQMANVPGIGIKLVSSNPYTSPPCYRLQAPLALVRHHAEDIGRAADLLHESHPDIARNNFYLMIAHSIVNEMYTLDGEDPWQDIGACDYADCSYRERFHEVFAGVPHGTRVWGHFVRPPWRTTSFLAMERARQGFGPAQIILGLAREAGSWEGVARYAPHLTENNFANDRAALRTILDPQGSIYTLALIYDYNLTQLKETMFRDPDLRRPVDLFPFIADRDSAREFELLLLAQHLKTFPERGPEMRRTFFANGYYLYFKMEYTGYALGIEPSWRGLMRSGWQRSVNEALDSIQRLILRDVLRLDQN